MRRATSPAVLALTLACATAGPHPAPPPSAPPPARDELLMNGAIYTLDPANPSATGLLIRDGKIACVGRLGQCAAQASRTARWLEVGRGSVVPGLGDAHVDVLRLGLAQLRVSCSGVAEEECVQRVAARVRTARPGEWIHGDGWDEARWPGVMAPTERALSAAAPSNPVVLRHANGEDVWVNAAALAAAGIDEETRAPVDGRILRYGDRRPSGVLTGRAADLVLRHEPAPSREQVQQALLAGLDALVGVGLTTVHDLEVDQDRIDAYRDLAASGRLPLRVHLALDGHAPREVLAADLKRAAEAPPLARLTQRSVRFLADGTLRDGKAALFRPYEDDPATSGTFAMPPPELRDRIRAVLDAGLQPVVLASGDRACAEVLSIFAAIAQERGTREPRVRPRLEHAQVLLDGDARTLRESGTVVSMNPRQGLAEAAVVDERLGAGTARARSAHAWKHVIDFGGTLAFGSNYPEATYDPRAALVAAELRVPPGASAPWHPEQRIERVQALRALTLGVAEAGEADDRRGMLKVGYDADLTVLREDLMAVPAEGLPTIPIAYTLVDGKIQFPRATSGRAPEKQAAGATAPPGRKP